MTLQELITDLKAAGANENTMQLAMNCYELGLANAQRNPLTDELLSATQMAIQCSYSDHGRRSVNAQAWDRMIQAIAAHTHGIKGPA